MENHSKNELTNSNKEEQEDLTLKYILENIQSTIILFCNPISGNQEGKIILDIASNYKTKENYKLVDFQYLSSKKAYEKIKLVVFELINKEDNAKGQVLLRQCSEKCKENSAKGLPEQFRKIRTLIGGGDGTVLSMIENFIKNGTDINYCIFGHIPLGTGNDLSNTLGFSDHINISENNLDDLYNVTEKYFRAKFGKIDIWKIDLKLNEDDGKILLNTKNGKVPLKDEQGNVIKRYIRTFINYASLGYDARIGYNFDPKRTNSRNKNKCIYFCEGFKKLLCRKTVSVQGFLDTLSIYDSSENSINQERFFDDIPKTENRFNLPSNDPNLKYQFISKNSYQKEIEVEKEKKILKKCLVIEGKPCSIIFQNISNYMSGVTDIWGKGKEHLAVEVKNVDKKEKKIYTEKLKEMADEKQKYNDKKIEVFTFDNGFETGFEKVIGGFAKKIYHGRGPMELKFLETPEYTDKDRKHRIYLNVDGEYFHIVKPETMRIELNRELCQGQLPFLVGNI